MALTFHYVFGVEKVWIDCAIVAIFCAIHFAANWAQLNLSADVEARDQAFSFVKELASASVTVVGILLPLSLAAVGTFAGKRAAKPQVLSNVFVADAWLALSLTLGLVVLWIAGFQAHTRNVQNLRGIRVLNGWQLMALVAGVVRLLIATFFLVQTAG